MDIDSIKQRPGDFAPVMVNSLCTASAIGIRITKVTARARIHGGDQLKSGWKVCLPARTRNRDAARFHRLAQNLKYMPAELRQFVEKQHAIVRPGYFSRPWI
jgi:hypothetical protein